jgi:hypothetical protein
MARRRPHLALAYPLTLGPTAVPHGETMSDKPAFTAYDGLSRSDAEEVTVHSLEQAAAELARAGDEGRTVALRAAGASFHDQAMGSDRVLLLGDMPPTLRREGDTLVVGPSATCGAVFDELLTTGHALPALPTSRRISIGGSLSADTLTRWSPFFRKLSSTLLAFDLFCPDGECRRIVRPGPGTSGLNDRLFRAVPGGFGLLGLIGEMTFAPVATGFPAGPAPRVQTRLSPTRSSEQHVSLVVDRWLATTPAPGLPDPDSMASIQAPWSIVNTEGVGCVLETELVPHDTPLEPFVVHAPDDISTRLQHMLSFSSVWNDIGWTFLSHTTGRKERTFVDDLGGFSFMMDANWIAREMARKMGVHPWLLQQSFGVPLDRDADEPGRPLGAFLDAVNRLAHDLDLTTDVIDLLFLREDDGLMSAARGSEAVVVSLAMQGLAQAKVERVKTFYRRLSEVCAILGGRVHLTKHVHVEPDVLQHMYGSALIELGELRRQVDPRRTLRSALYDRVLGPAWGDA